jgi:Uma2 family endonuclease
VTGPHGGGDPLQVLVRQDRGTKAALHARFRIPHYWIVDPETRNFEAHVLEGDAYRLVIAARDAERGRPTLFPTLEIDLSRVWA